METKRTEQENFLLSHLNIQNEDGCPCLLIMNNGRSHEISILDIHDGLIFANIANYLRVCLYAPDASSSRLILRIDSIQEIQRECYGGDKEVLVDQPCFVKTNHKFVANLKEFSAVEVLKFPYFKFDPRQERVFDESIFIDNIPQLRDYYINGVGFVRNSTQIIQPIVANGLVNTQEHIK